MLVRKIRRTHLQRAPKRLQMEHYAGQTPSFASNADSRVPVHCSGVMRHGSIPELLPTTLCSLYLIPFLSSQLATTGIFLRCAPRQMHDRPAPTARRFTARCRGIVAAGRRTAAVQRRPTATASASAATAERRHTASKPISTPAASNAVNAIPDSFVTSLIALSNCAAFRALRNEPRPSFRPVRYGAAT